METENRIPADVLCGACGYLLEGLPRGVCPECGRPVRDEDIDGASERRSSEKRARRLALAQVGIGLAFAGTIAVGVAVVSGKAEAGGAFMLCATGAWLAAICSGWAVGGVAIRSMRSAWRLAWLRSHPFLHVSWLVTPICATAVMLIVRSTKEANAGAGTRTMLFVPLMLAAFIAWCLATTWGVGSFERRWVRERARMGLAEERPLSMFALLQTLVITAAVVLAFVMFGLNVMALDSLSSRR